MLLNSRWGCQNHPEARIATSFAGWLGVVSISGHMPLLLVMANPCGVRDMLGVNEEQADSRDVPIAAAIVAFMIS
jgi:hypothetical protein